MMRALLSLLIPAALCQSQELCVVGDTWIDAGRQTQKIQSADFDNNSTLDLIVLDITQGLLVVPGRGDGTFATPTRIVHDPFGAADFLASHLDKDGGVDLILANDESNRVRTYLSRDGHGKHQDFSTDPQSPITMLLAEFNGDAIADLAVSVARMGFGGGKILILFGSGKGNFLEPVEYVIDQAGISMAAADINGDRLVDLLVGSHERVVYTLLGEDDGQFVKGDEATVGLSPRGISIADLDGDGNMDLVTAHSDDDDISVLMGNGDGTFGAQRRFPVGDQPWFVITRDLNEDGIEDLLVTVRGERGGIRLFRGRGNGQFSLWQTLLSRGPAGGPMGAALGDLNGDGAVDIAIPSGGISLFLQTDKGKFGNQLRFEIGEHPVSMALGDVNRDGWLDVAAVNLRDRSFTVLLGQPGGDFQPGGSFRTGGTPEVIELADLDGDSRLDAIVGCRSSESIFVHPGDEENLFADGVAAARSPWPVCLETGDVDNDGVLDVIVVDVEVSEAKVPEVVVLFGDGVGGFRRTSTVGDATAPQSVSVVDLDQDGNLDLAIADRSPDSILVHYGVGDGVFGVGPQLTVEAPSLVKAADVNGDHFADIVALSEDRQKISVFVASENRRFSDALTLETRLIPKGLALGDVNHDEVVDLVVCGAPSDVSVLLGQGAGTFLGEAFFRTGADPYAVGIWDVDRDGSPDVLTSNRISQDVAILRNCLAAPGPRFVRGDCDGIGGPLLEISDALHALNYLFLGQVQPNCMAACDVNADSRLDVSDAVFIVHFLFFGGRGPMEPYPHCRDESLHTALGCELSASCP